MAGRFNENPEKKIMKQITSTKEFNPLSSEILIAGELLFLI